MDLESNAYENNIKNRMCKKNRLASTLYKYMYYFVTVNNIK